VDRVTYRRSFEIPKGWSGQQVVLHFGAVDWETKVTLNGKELDVHRGGYPRPTAPPFPPMPPALPPGSPIFSTALPKTYLPPTESSIRGCCALYDYKPPIRGSVTRELTTPIFLEDLMRRS
jgi:hypothetical protein